MPVPIERKDALLILRKWFEESRPLSCRIKSPFLWASLDGRITFLDDEKVAVKPADGPPGSGFSVALEAARTFKYGDSRSVPEEAEIFECGLLPRRSRRMTHLC